MIAVSRCGFGNRIRCYLHCLMLDETSTINWSNVLIDGKTTKEEYRSCGYITPFNLLFDYTQPTAKDGTIYCSANYTNKFDMLYNKYHDDIRDKCVELRKKYLIPQEYIVDRCFNYEFKYGFQIRLWNETVKPFKDINSVNREVIDFIKSSKEPIFLTCDNEYVLNELSQNKNVFYYKRKYKKNFNLEWDISLMEIMTLAKCDELFLTHCSTFGEMGYLFGDCKPKVKLTYKEFNQPYII